MIIEHEKFFSESLEVLRNIEKFLGESHAQVSRLDEVEQGLLTLLFQFGRQLLEDYVGAAGDGDQGPTLEYEGQTLQRLEKPHSRMYRSIFGDLNIERWVYATREKQKILWAPLDAQLGLPAGEQSYVLEKWLGRLVGKEAYGEAVKDLRELLGIKGSVRSAEGMARRMSADVAGFRASQAPSSKENEEKILVAVADGKGVPMRRPLEQRLHEELGRSKRKSTPRRQGKRRGKGSRKSRKQMAYVGAAYSIAPFVRGPDDVLDEMHRRERAADRPRPQNKRVWAEMTKICEGELSEGPRRLFLQLALDLGNRDPKSKKILVCIMDGQRSLWTMQRAYLGCAVGILDLFHVMERLWKAAYCFHAENSDPAEAFADHYLRLLLEGKVSYVIGVFRRYIKRYRLRGAKRKTLNQVIAYFAENKAHMRYDEYLAAGLPIGSGVAEGACRHVVKDRLECTGMRWEIEGAQCILDLRTTYLNGDWQNFIEYRIAREQRDLYGREAGKNTSPVIAA